MLMQWCTCDHRHFHCVKNTEKYDPFGNLYNSAELRVSKGRKLTWAKLWRFPTSERAESLDDDICLQVPVPQSPKSVMSNCSRGTCAVSGTVRRAAQRGQESYSPISGFLLLFNSSQQQGTPGPFFALLPPRRWTSLASVCLRLALRRTFLPQKNEWVTLMV